MRRFRRDLLLAKRSEQMTQNEENFVAGDVYSRPGDHLIVFALPLIAAPPVKGEFENRDFVAARR